ncbi:MAG: hypothetical protein ACRBN8_14785 [Nannocystales bacterium]
MHTRSASERLLGAKKTAPRLMIGAVKLGLVALLPACGPVRGDPDSSAESGGTSGTTHPSRQDTGSTSHPTPERASSTAASVSTTEEAGSTGDGSFDVGDRQAPEFSDDVWPLLKGRCSCHVGFAAGGLRLADESAYETLVDGDSLDTDLALVEPGSLEKSYLWRKLVGQQAGVGGDGVRMPMSGTPLTDEELTTIEGWIVAGAPL